MRITIIAVLLVFSFGAICQSLPSIEEKTKGLKNNPGFLNFYWDDAAGKLWLEIDKPGTELLYVTSLPAGLGSNDIGLDRGLLGSTHVVKFVRSGRKLLMTQPNYDYRAITTNVAEKRAVEQSFAQSVLWGFTIEAESNGKLLVDATDFLLRDAMKASNQIRSMRQGNFSFDKSRSAIYPDRTKNFPLNTEVEATITLVSNDGEAGNFVRSVTPSADAITLRMHHSFVQLPDDGYKPRIFDPRSSFINISYFDYSSPVSESIEKHLAIRHRLQKKDPSAVRSEAVKPIIYYVDNGTPEPIRSALIEGAQWWNQAFEAAGYINAFQVKVLPEDADPMDVRYNVINWVHRSTRGWSYGASIVDPRTGEIIKGHVTLGSLRVRQDYLIAQGLLSPFENGEPADDKMLAMALNRLKQLSAHEVGHTIGIMHNYAASVEERSSVMDYPAPAVTLNTKGEIDLESAYSLEIGDWDKVSVAWGYQDFPMGVNEKEGLNKILGDAYQRGLQFITDRDARAPGGSHAAAHLWDNGNDPVSELENLLRVREKAIKDFGENTIRKGVPMAMLEDALVPVYLMHRYQVEAVSKIVGGMMYTYALKGDGQTITKSVTKADQVKGLQAIIRSIDPKVLVLPEKIIRLIPPRPSGYDYTKELFKKRTGLSIDALSPAETAADLPLSFLFNSERMNRLVQVQNNGLDLNEMIDGIVTATWKSPRRKGMEGLIQFQTEQIILTYLLAGSIDDNNSFITKSVIGKYLTDLKGFIEGQRKSASDKVYDGHLLLALKRMTEPEKAKPTIHVPIPPGAPIGCEQ